MAVALAAILAAAGCSGSSAPDVPDASDDAGDDASDDAAPDVALPPACSETDPRSPPTTLIVMPDQGQAPFVAVLDKATATIDMLDYDLGQGEILSTLLAKAQAGVAVRVILDASEQSFNQPAFDSLGSAGAEVEWSDPQFTYMHAKSFVVDGVEAVISTGNFVASQMAEERNYAVVDDDAQDVAELSALIAADWARQVPDLSCTRLLVSPVNSKPRILALIASATTTLDVESMELSDTDVQAALVAAQKRGVAMRVIIADTNFVSANSAVETFLTGASIPGKTLSDPVVHVKSILVDGARAYLGSENLSWTSLTKNREVGVEIVESQGEDVAGMEATFDEDWAAASTF